MMVIAIYYQTFLVRSGVIVCSNNTFLTNSVSYVMWKTLTALNGVEIWDEIEVVPDIVETRLESITHGWKSRPFRDKEIYV